MTLLEIMVTLAVIGLVLGITISQVGDSFDSRARQVTRELSSTIRYLYNKAASENLTMRIVFDLDPDKQSYWVEATTERFQVETEEDRERSLKKADSEVTLVQKAEAKFGSVDSHLLKPVKLPGGVFFKDIFTEHDAGPVTTGMAYIHIFPSGYVERSIINIRNEDDSEKRAVEVNPMTGTTRTFDDYRELKK